MNSMNNLSAKLSLNQLNTLSDPLTILPQFLYSSTTGNFLHAAAASVNPSSVVGGLLHPTFPISSSSTNSRFSRGTFSSPSSCSPSIDLTKSTPPVDSSGGSSMRNNIRILSTNKRLATDVQPYVPISSLSSFKTVKKKRKKMTVPSTSKSVVESIKPEQHDYTKNVNTTVIGNVDPTFPTTQDVKYCTEFSCTLCSFRCFSLADYELHEKCVHHGERNVKDEMCSMQNCTIFEPHSKRHCQPPRNYKCTSCGLSFIQKSHLQNHIKSLHLPENRSFHCAYCDYSSVSKGTLDKHIKCVHAGQRPFECTNCDKKFGQKVHLESHVAAVHMMNKPFACPYNECGYRGAMKGLLKKHVQTVHLKEKPFTCLHCPAKFGQKAHLQKHLVSLHLKDKPYKCDECSFETASSMALHRHVSIIHRGEKAFHCQICDNSFGQKDSLMKHVRKIHGIDTPFKCVHCTDSYKTALELKRHVSLSHGGIADVMSATKTTASSERRVGIVNVGQHHYMTSCISNNCSTGTAGPISIGSTTPTKVDVSFVLSDALLANRHEVV